jgi:hypothetical protein
MAMTMAAMEMTIQLGIQIGNEEADVVLGGASHLRSRRSLARH